MKGLKLLIINIFFLIPSGVFAQTVSATFFNVPQQKVYLNAFNGLYIDVMDSVMMSQDKRVDFNSQLRKGLYQLETEYGDVVDFLYDDGAVKMIVKDINDKNSIEFIDSPANRDWYVYSEMKERTQNSLSLLKPILRAYNKNSEFYKESLNEYQQIQDAFVSFTDSLILNENYASTLIRVDRFPTLNLNDDFKKQRQDMIANFFNDVDFNDTTLIPTDVMTNKIYDFLSIQMSPDQDEKQRIMSLILGTDNVLCRASVNFEMYKFVYQFLIEMFNEMRLVDIVDYMTRIPYYEDLKCTEDQRKELLAIAEFNSKARIGDVAENIYGMTVFDQEFSLYDIESEYTIVFFWSYTCDHCREDIKSLKLFLDENPDFSMVAVSVKGDLKKIKNLVKKNKVDGYFYHDGLEWDCPFVNDYAVVSTPSFYLLDKDKKIVYKPFDFNELVNFVNIVVKR